MHLRRRKWLTPIIIQPINSIFMDHIFISGLFISLLILHYNNGGNWVGYYRATFGHGAC